MEFDFEKLELIRLPRESGEWRYHIPNGYTAEIVDGFVVIRPAESEDERIRKAIIELLKEVGRDDTGISENAKCMIAYLEKQKEPTEELSTRLNGLMQEYVKSGKDEEEQEHRLKCYQLFWDALEDSEFFEQEEQKPTPDWMPKFLDELRSKKNYFDWDEHRDIEGHILAIIKWIAPDYFHRKEKGQKPLPGFDDLTPDEKMNHPLYLEGFDAGREVGRVEAEQKPEWSEEDEEMLVGIIERGSAQIPPFEPALRGEQMEWLMNRLKSLRPSWKPSEEQMRALHELLGGKVPRAPELYELYNDLEKLM